MEQLSLEKTKNYSLDQKIQEMEELMQAEKNNSTLLLNDSKSVI